MGTEVDLNRTISLVSEGLHIFQIVEFDEKTGPKGPYWEFRCKVAERGPDQGAETLLRVSLSMAARWKMNEFLDAMKSPLTGKVQGQAFLGKLFKGHVMHQENPDNGRVNANIDACMAYEVAQAAAPGTAVPVTEQIVSQMPDPFVAPDLGHKDDDIPF